MMVGRVKGPIRAVLFDVDGTLYDQPTLRMAMTCEMALASLANLMTWKANDVRLVMAFRRVREDLRTADSIEEPLAGRQYSAVARRLGCQPADVEQAVEQWIYRRPLKWLRFCRRKGIERLLAVLNGRGVRCGVFSDYPAHDKVAALGLGGRFDLELSAVDAEIDAFKPDPKGFQVAAARWGIPPEEILYVGDRAEVDAVGALAAGMQCAVVTRRPGHGRPGFITVTDFAELQRVLDPVC
jgi:HAD superfamily hydrolase (TIGR01549 family)